MAIYTGRAKTRTGSVNRKQRGLKQAGCAGKVGRKGAFSGLYKKRAPCRCVYGSTVFCCSWLSRRSTGGLNCPAFYPNEASVPYSSR